MVRRERYRDKKGFGEGGSDVSDIVQMIFDEWTRLDVFEVGSDDGEERAEE